jgi:hypothetical protein
MGERGGWVEGREPWKEGLEEELGVKQGQRWGRGRALKQVQLTWYECNPIPIAPPTDPPLPRRIRQHRLISQRWRVFLPPKPHSQIPYSPRMIDTLNVPNVSNLPTTTSPRPPPGISAVKVTLQQSKEKEKKRTTHRNPMDSCR